MLVDHLAPSPGQVVVGLGCGEGATLAAAADRAAGLRVVGIDIDTGALDDTAALLAGRVGALMVVAGDLGRGIPLASGSAHRMVCHNVLEQLPDPGAVLAEAARVMAPGGRSVWSHTDFESVVISGADPDLTRRVVRAHADTPDTGAALADGRLGRKLAGLVRASPLELTSVDARVLMGTRLEGPAHLRVLSTYALLKKAVSAGRCDLGADELDGWLASLAEADTRGAFFYAHTTFIAVARRP